MKYGIVTGGLGLLGLQHCNALIEIGVTPIILDLKSKKIFKKEKSKISKNKDIEPLFFSLNISNEKKVKNFFEYLYKKNIDPEILINNAAINPVPKKEDNHFEKYNLKNWNNEIEIGLSAIFIMSKNFMKFRKKNSYKNIVNISSDLGLIAPDQRIYGNFFNKPISYSVVKHGVIGITKYLSTFYLNDKFRCNCLCPGGVYNGHDPKFVKKLSKLIPFGRMAKLHEYKGAIKFLCSDMSSYMNGSTLVIDGGRTVW